MFGGSIWRLTVVWWIVQAIRWGTLLLLYLLAAPIYLLLALCLLPRLVRGLRAIRSGMTNCSACALPNSLNRLTTCHRCGAAEYGCRLFCTNCGRLSHGFPCDRCTAVIPIF